MSSSEEEFDDSHRTEHDYEFDTYAQNERRKRQKVAQGRRYRKDDALYGVFMDDLYEEGHRSRGLPKKSLNEPISFVSSSKEPKKSKEQKSRKEENEANVQDGPSLGLGFGSAPSTGPGSGLGVVPSSGSNNSGGAGENSTGTGLGFVKSGSSGSAASSGAGLGFVKSGGSNSESSSGAGLGFVKSGSSGAGLGFVKSGDSNSESSSGAGLGFVKSGSSGAGLGFVKSGSSNSESSSGAGLGFVKSGSSGAGLGFVKSGNSNSESSSGAGLGFVKSASATAGNSAGEGLGFVQSGSAGAGLGFVKSSSTNVEPSTGTGLGYTAPDVPTQASESMETDEDRENKFRRLAKGVDAKGGKLEGVEYRKDSAKEKETKSSKSEKKSKKASLKTKKPKPVDKNIGLFEKHSKGFGMKYLQKFGFEGRLGKEGQGITAPIAVKVRPKNVGLGLISEANELPENKKIEEEQYGKRRKEKKAKEAAEGLNMYKTEGDDFDKGLSELWRKTGPGKSRKKKKPVYKVASDILEEAETTDKPQGTIKIIDMRHKTPKVLSGLDDMDDMSTSSSSSSESDSESSQSDSDKEGEEEKNKMIDTAELPQIRYKGIIRKKKKFGQELKFNIQSLVKIAESELRNVHQKQLTHGERKKELEERLSNLEISQNTSATRIEELQKVMQALTDCNKKCKQSDNDALSTVRSIKEIWDNHAQYVQMFDLDRFALSIADRCTEKWANSYQFGSGVNFPVSFPEDLRTYIDLWSNIVPNDLKFRNFIKNTLDQHVVPKVIRLFTNSFEQFNTGNDYEVLVKWTVDIITYFSELGYPLLTQAIIDRAVVPKLNNYVSSWKYQSESKRSKPVETNFTELPLHIVIHPWIPFIGKMIRENLHREIRRKLEKAVTSMCKRFSKKHTNIWEDLRSILCPWQSVFSSNTFNKLVDNALIPGLEEILGSLIINPNAQDDKPFQAVVKTVDILGRERCTALLIASFFPKWLRVLRKWLSSIEPNDLSQPAQWFSGWKGQFPADMLEREDEIRVQFDLAIHWFDTKLQGLPIVEEAPPDTSYQSVYERFNPSKGYPDKRNRKIKEQGKPKPIFDRDEFADYKHSRRGFREVVEAIAEDKGVAFMRHMNNKHVDGNLIYVIRDIEVYFHEKENVLFTRGKETGHWEPVCIQDVMEPFSSA